MSQAEITQTWIRWLDNRPVNHEAADRLVAIADQNESVANQMLQDLDLHRQLRALGHIQQDDFSFVGQLLVRFESEMVTMIRPEDLGDERVTEVAVVAPIVDESDFAIDIKARPAGLPVPSTGDTSTGSRRQAIWAAALCLPLLVALLFTSYQMGRHSVVSHPVDPAQKTGNDGQAKLTRTAPDLSAPVENPNAPDVPTPKPEKSRNQGPKQPETNPQRPGRAMVQHPSRFQPDASPDQPLPELPEKPGAAPAFATIQNAENAVWKTTPDSYPRIGLATLELLSGKAVIEFDTGGAITLQGPAQLVVDQGFVEIERGKFEVDLPAIDEEQFLVQAGSSKIQPTGKTLFNVNVEPDGSSSVAVDRGAVTVKPWQAVVRGEPVKLSRTGFRRLQIEGEKGNQPLMASLTGDGQTQFEGLVNYNGQVVRSTDRELINRIYQRACERFDEAPGKLDGEWDAFSRLAFPGTGQSASPGNEALKEMQERMRKAMEEVMPPGFRFPDFPEGEFQGSFSFGQDQDGNTDFQFSGQSMEEANQMMRQKLGSFADFADEIKK